MRKILLTAFLVALLILEDRNAPSGIRVGVRYW